MSAKATWQDYGLAAASWLSQLIAFALLLASLIGPVPNYSAGSSLATVTNLAGDVTSSKVWIGPLGSCVTAQSEPTVVCTTSSFSPNLNSSYALAGVPNDLITALPSEIPDLPSLLLLVIILTVISLALLGCAVLPRCFPERMSGSPMQLYGSLLTKISIGTSGIGFIFALTAIVCLFLQFSQSFDPFNELAVALELPWTAELERAFPQLWAGLALLGVSILAQLVLVLSMPAAQIKLRGFQWA